MCPSLIQIGSKTAEKTAQTNKQTDRQANRHYENNGHLAVNQQTSPLCTARLMDEGCGQREATQRWTGGAEVLVVKYRSFKIARYYILL